MFLLAVPVSWEFFTPWFTAQAAIAVTMIYSTRLRIKRKNAADLAAPEAMVFQACFKTGTRKIVFPNCKRELYRRGE